MYPGSVRRDTIPYVSSVLFLPISVFYRSFTFEFLAQFEPSLLPSAVESPEQPG